MNINNLKKILSYIWRVVQQTRAVWRNGGRSPQKRQCEFESLYPAGSSVEAATTPSRHHEIIWINHRIQDKK